MQLHYDNVIVNCQQNNEAAVIEKPHIPRALIPHIHNKNEDKLCFNFNISPIHLISLSASRRSNNMNPWKWNLTPANLLSQQFAYPRQSHLFVEDTPNPNSSVIKESRGAQLTIFYDGQVTVFDDIPAEKAKDIMSFATKRTSQSHNNYAYYAFPANVVTSSSTSTSPLFPFPINIFPPTPNTSIQEHPRTPSKPVVCDLPLARKASLHRFLEKRKDRIAARAPYQTSNPMEALNKGAEYLPWLAMAPKSPRDESESSSSFGLF